MKMRYAVALLFAALLFFAPAARAAETDMRRLIAQSEVCRLWLDEKTAQITVEDMRGGQTWTAFPEDAATDKKATGAYKMNLQSLLVVQYANENLITSRVNSRVGSVNKGGFRYEEIENGARLTFDFPRSSEQFVLRVDVTLSGDTVYVEMPFDAIEEYGAQRVCSVAVLPYFGAAKNTDEGYVLVPDGCGALIAYDKAYPVFSDYEKSVYGRSETLASAMLGERSETLSLPVFGARRNGAAYLCRVTAGDCALTVEPPMLHTGYCAAYMTATVRTLDGVVLMTDAGQSGALVSSGDIKRGEKFSARYTFLSAERADYVGMAATLREQLESERAFALARTGACGICLTLTGEATYRRIFDLTETLTTFSQGETILRALNDAGVPVSSVLFTDWYAGGAGGYLYAGQSPDARLGGVEELNLLNDAVRGAGGTTYLEIASPHADRLGGGYFKSAFANGLGRTTTALKTFRLSTLTQNTDAALRYLLAPHRLPALAEAFLRSDAALPDVGVSPGALARTVYTDYRDGAFVSFTEVRAFIERTLATYSRAHSLLLSAPNLYAFPYASEMTNIPVYSSRHALFSGDVPFLQMVLHGNCAYSSTPLNESDDAGEMLLKMAEYGATPQLALIYADPAILKQTPHDAYYARKWDARLGEMAQMCVKLCETLEKVGDARIVSHANENGLARAVYDNGVTIYVNYGVESAVIDGITVPARVFVTREGTP